MGDLDEPVNTLHIFPAEGSEGRLAQLHEFAPHGHDTVRPEEAGQLVTGGIGVTGGDMEESELHQRENFSVIAPLPQDLHFKELTYGPAPRGSR